MKRREVEDKTGNGYAFTDLEIAHTLPIKKTPQKESIYNYFYSRKQKGRKFMPENADQSILQKRPYKKIIKEGLKTVEFDR